MRTISRDDAMARVSRDVEALDPRHRGCVPCALVECPAAVRVAEDPRAVVLLDRYACREGHMMVVLRRHETHVAALPWEDWCALQRLAWEATRALESALAPRRVFVASLGAVDPLPCSFPHVHLHVVPLYEGGDSSRPARVFSWSEGVMVYDPGEDHALAERLRAAWPTR